ncbi:MAG: hypothetical protein V4708_16905 [Bacteroidota bacterium]
MKEITVMCRGREYIIEADSFDIYDGILDIIHQDETIAHFKEWDFVRQGVHEYDHPRKESTKKEFDVNEEINKFLKGLNGIGK